VRGGPAVSYGSRAIYRGLIRDRTHKFTASCQPFNITMNPGSSGNYGIGYLADGQVPIAGTFPGGGSNLFTISFTLSNVVITWGSGATISTSPLTNYAEYQNLFDSYRISAVEVTMMFNNNFSNTATNTTCLPQFGVAADYDDGIQTGWTSLAQYDNFQVLQFGLPSKKVIRIKPIVSTSVENQAGAFVPANGSRTQWLDCASSNIQYFGLKYAWDNPMVGAASNAQNEGYITFHCKYFLEFKGTR